MSDNKKKLDSNYKFKDLLIYASNESFEGNKKKYRRVFENKETKYIYVELSFYNKLFDEEDWETDITINAYRLNSDGSRKELCSLTSKRSISKDENIVIVRESWGKDEPGTFWKRGDYEWEAFIGKEKVDSKRFYVEDGGLVNHTENPYFDIDSVNLYNGPFEGVALDQRKYLTQFHSDETQYVFVEFNAKNSQTKSWYCEVIFNFYNDAGQLKGSTSELKYVGPNDQNFTITSGWGSSKKGTWFYDKYTVEIVFMDYLIAVIPFTVADKAVEGEAQLIKPSQSASIFPNYGQQDHEKSLEEILEELQEMVGLETVKGKIQDYTHYLKFLRLRQEQGFEENTQISLHSVFMGNPGTGKTTVAKMLGKIYHKMGLLSKGNVLEVGRAELVGKFIGQTAPKTKEMIEKARGGVLFIDEAYALARKGDNDSQDFGQEVIEVLIKEMSDGKGDIAIIAAGYPAEMDNFLNTNPGLKSRFNLVYNFPDYTPQELVQILDYKAEKKKVTFTEDAKDLITKQLTELYRNRDNTFGNARLVTSLIEEAKMNMGLRIIRSDDYEKLSHSEFQEIQIEDVESVFKTTKHKTPDIAIDEELLTESIQELNELTGLSNVKNEINELVKLVRFYKESGRDVLNKFSLHTIFTGNPGTGKTTVARIISKIFKALGILERGHLVECDRQSLVAGYVGQTAIKTQEKINNALGGVLFIDEAYALANNSENDFGKEAIETILKQMEDKRGEFVVIVAGYPDNMHEFLRSNPGLASRFDMTLHFEDYMPEDLFNIALDMFKSENISPDAEATQYLKEYFDYSYQKRDKFFGNARDIRKVVHKAVRNQNLRVASLPMEERTNEAISKLALADVEEFSMHKQGVSDQSRIGFKLSSDAREGE